MMKPKPVLALAFATMLALPTLGVSSESKPAILTQLDAPNVQLLETDEIDAMRGKYFSSFRAALRFCVLSYPGCSGSIERVSVFLGGKSNGLAPAPGALNQLRQVSTLSTDSFENY